MRRPGIGTIGVLLLVSAWQANAQTRTVEGIAAESRMTYRLAHPLHKIEAVSKEVLFKVEADAAGKTVTGASARVEVTTFNSGNSNRDSHAMEVIDALTYPEATFSSTSITREGDSLRVSGKLTFHGVTKEVLAPAKLSISGRRLTIEGTFTISLSAYNVERPSLLLMPVEDTLRFSFTAVFPWE